MSVGRNPTFVRDKRLEIRPQMQVVFEDAGAPVRAFEQQAPDLTVALEAGELEARQRARRLRDLVSIDRGDTLESNSPKLLAHMREPVGVPIEVDEIDPHRQRTGRFLKLSSARRARRRDR